MGKMSVKFLCCGLSKFLLREEQEKFVIAKEWFTLWWQGVGRGRREGACCDCWMANAPGGYWPSIRWMERMICKMG